MKNLITLFTAFIATVFSYASQAASVIPADVLTALTDDGTATLTAIGGAMLGLAATAVLFKWAKAAMFG